MSSSDVASAVQANLSAFFILSLWRPARRLKRRPGIRGASFRHRRSRGRAMVCEPDRLMQNQLRCGPFRRRVSVAPVARLLCQRRGRAPEIALDHNTAHVSNQRSINSLRVLLNIGLHANIFPQ